MDRRRIAALAAAVLVAVAAGCHRAAAPGPPPIAGLTDVAAAPAGPSWAPRPIRTGNLSVLATATADGFRLSTAHGSVGFLAGVNLGGTTPGHQPGELAISTGQYRDWFAAMGRLGVRTVRIYTIHPPAFYTELRRYNTAHRDAPLYLLQGVYLPDESYVQKQDLYDRAVTDAFTGEIDDAVSAVHGTLDRTPQRGRASGSWRADVTDWLAGWIIGVEWDPYGTQASDRRNAGQPGFTGTYFGSTPDASPTERWLAAKMDHLATAEAGRGRSMPIAFANWPTTDPLRHPEEPLEQEDLVGVDANHVRPTAAWPGGTFASYHAYPYYPDFQRHEPAYGQYTYQGRADRYAGYLDALKRHHAEAGMPVLITETGQPASIGSAHGGPLGRDQGDHSEQDALRTDAALLRLVKDVGLAGAILFAWTDEWFKVTWNTATHQTAERRQLWHDALTNEQWFGLLAMDPTGYANPDTRTLGARDPVRQATATVDEGYLHLDLRLRRKLDGPVVLGIDAVPAVTGSPAPDADDRRADLSITLDPTARQAQEWVRQQVDPLPLDYAAPAGSRPAPRDGWLPYQLTTNRPLTIPSTGEALPMEFLDVGKLRYGSWDPQASGYDVRSVWRVDGDRLRVRLPWALAGLSDPSSHLALLPGAPDDSVKIKGLGLTVRFAATTVSLGQLTWNYWTRVGYQARLKAGAADVRDALVAVSG